jgi:hypothetical protein
VVLESVDVGKQSIGDYEACAGREMVEQLRSLAKPLREARVLHLNATPYGGGVAEILVRLGCRQTVVKRFCRKARTSLIYDYLQDF